MISAVELSAQSLATGLKQLRKWGFRIHLEREATRESPEEQERRARIAACNMLGLEESSSNMNLLPVKNVAGALLQNAIVE